MRIALILTREFFIVLSLGAEWDFSDSEIGLAIIYVEVVDVGFHEHSFICITDVPDVVSGCHQCIVECFLQDLIL